MTDVPISIFNVLLFDADGFFWDISIDNSFVINGTRDAFDGGFRWTDYRSSGGTHVLTDGREVNLGQTQLVGQVAGLLGARSIYVSDTKGYARVLDTITNTTSSTVTYTYDFYTDLGSDTGTQIITTSDGDLVFDPTDSYLTTDDFNLTSGDPTVTHVFNDGTLTPTSASLSRGDDVRTSYTVTIPAGESLSFLFFGFQNDNPTDAAAQLLDFGNNLDAYLEGLSGEELVRLANFAISTGDGTPGDDLIVGTGENDTIFGLAGNDRILGGPGDDLINASGGSDSVVAGAGDDTVLAGTGADLITDGQGSDVYELAGGNDTLILDDPVLGDDVANGGSGFDLLNLTGLSGRIFVDLEAGTVSNLSGDTDVATSFENVLFSDGGGQIAGSSRSNALTGGDGADTIFADGGNDTIVGGNGNDRLFGEAGSDQMQGGVGDDSLFGGNDEDLLLGDAGNDRLVGGSANDTLEGGAGDDRLIGQAGDDLLVGGSGADHLIGGAGSDRYVGGLGDDILVDDGPVSEIDTFVFSFGDGNDLLSGYDQGFNVIELDASLWGGGLSAQQVVNRFAYQSLSDNRIVFDFGSDSLQLVNGTGLDIATLANDLVLV